MRRFSQLLVGLLLAFGGPAVGMAGTAAAADLDEEQLAGTLEAIHAFNGHDVAPYQETSMVDGSDAESGLPRIVRVSNGVLDCAPPRAYASLRAAPFLLTISPGDDTFTNGIDLTHVWIIEFEGNIAALDAGIAEVGIALYDAGAPGLDDPTFPTAATSGATRTVAAVVGALIEGGATGVYGVVNERNELDVFPNPLYIGVGQLDNGNSALVIAGPFSPEFAAYISGLGEDVASADELADRMAGFVTRRFPPATEPITAEQRTTVPDGSTQFSRDPASVTPAGDAEPTADEESGSSEGSVTPAEPAAESTAESADADAVSTANEEATEPTGADEVVAISDGAESSSSGNFFWALAVGIVAAIVAVVLYFFRHSLFARSDETEAVDDAGAAATSGGKIDAPTAPATGTPAPPPGAPGDPEACTWEFEFRERGGWSKLRAAIAGQRVCCTYRMSIETVQDHDEMGFCAPELVDDHRPRALNDTSASATDLESVVATKTGPEEQGETATALTDPPTAESLIGVPDVAADGIVTRVSHHESTTLAVTFESEDPTVQHQYGAGVASALDITASALRPTVDGEPGPLTHVVGSGNLAASNDLTTRTAHELGALDGEWREGADGWASYRHSATSSDHRDKDDTAWSATFVSALSALAGHEISAATWPAEAAVAAHLEMLARHTIELRGHVIAGQPGGAACDCAPSFELSLDGDDSVLVVDGKTFLVSREGQPDRSGTVQWSAAGDPTAP